MTGRAVYFDLETGGLEPAHPDIQLAAIAVDEQTGAELETFETKIEFDPALADPKALELNHYRAEDWAGAKTPFRAVGALRSLLDRHATLSLISGRTGKPFKVAKLCGHNAATFDGPRLKALFVRHGFFPPWDPRVRCTMQRALWWFDERPELAPPENYRLETLCRYFGIPIADTHEALADVRLTIALARALAAPLNTEVRS